MKELFLKIIKKYKIILSFLLLFSFIFVYEYFVTLCTFDEIWNYGFSYNIVHGLIPYNDFNMVQLPFYFFMIASLMKVFGTSLLVFHLINAFLVSIVLLLTCKNNIVKSFCISLFLLIIPCSYGYNIFSSIILIIILFLENSNYKYRNELIGLLIGMVLMTKINLGLFMFIPYFIYSKQKVKSILFTIVIPVLCFIYFIISDSLINCIDDCFLGLHNFSNNLVIEWVILILDIIVIGILLYKFIKKKNKVYLYLILFQGILYPICDYHHFLIGMLPVAYYFINYTNNKYENYIVKMAGIICFGIYTFLDFYNYEFPRSFPLEKLNSIESYIKNNSNKKIYILNYYAYLIKLDLNMKINKYDLSLQGNMGSDESKYVDKLDSLCKNNNDCIFILLPPDGEYNQTSTIITNYVINNYSLINKIDSFEIYGNKE